MIKSVDNPIRWFTRFIIYQRIWTFVRTPINQRIDRVMYRSVRVFDRKHVRDIRYMLIVGDFISEIIDEMNENE